MSICGTYTYTYTQLYSLQAEILRVDGREREAIPLTGHTNYVQGVAWDPLGEYVVTQSADRSVKLYPVSVCRSNCGCVGVYGCMGECMVIAEAEGYCECQY